MRHSLSVRSRQIVDLIAIQRTLVIALYGQRLLRGEVQGWVVHLPRSTSNCFVRRREQGRYPDR